MGKVLNLLGNPSKLNTQQKDLLIAHGLPVDFAHLTDEEYFKIDDVVTEEMMSKGLTEDGCDLNNYGLLCESVILQLPME